MTNSGSNGLGFVDDPFDGTSLFDLDSDPTERNDLLADREPTPRQKEEWAAWKERTST